MGCSARWMVIASVWLGVSAAHAQTGSVTGSLVDAQTLRPLAAVQVFIPQLSIGVISGPDGTYTLVNVPAGQHEVRAQMLGYRVVNQQVSVTAGETAQLNISLTQDVLALDEVIVTGTAGGTQRRAVGNVVGGPWRWSSSSRRAPRNL